MLDFQPIGETRCQLGEGPVYDDRRETLWYCDIVGRAIHAHDLQSGEEKSWSFDSEVGSLGLCESGRLVVALRSRVGLFDPESGSFDEIARIEDDIADTRLNDGKVGPDGAFWVGTMDDGNAKPRRTIGALYRVDASGNVDRKVEGLAVSNGLAWSPDERVMYHSDSSAPRIDRWDFDPATGTIANRKLFAEPGDETGRPDGAAVDADGYYWSAGVSAGRLNRFSPIGELVEQQAVPVAAPTMPCFAGPGLTRLFVTSLIRDPAALQSHPLTGIVVSAASAVAGAPVTRFRDVG